MQRKNKQKGFTIIELVVVILLLGILTATALPRFMDVEDQAHGAVVNAVKAGLQTSAGLARAQWFAEGQPLYPQVVTGYDDAYASPTGYPIGIDSTDIKTTSLLMDDVNACYDICNSFLQPGGRPTIQTLTAAAGAVDSTDIRGITTLTSDFVAYLDTTSATTRRQCVYVYTGQYTDPTLGNLPVLTYNADTGVVSAAADVP